MIHQAVREVIRQLDVQVFVETGTLAGETCARVSEWFAQLDPSFGALRARVRDDELAQLFPKRPVAYPVFEGTAAACPRRVITVDTNCTAQERLKAVFASNPHIRVVCAPSEVFLRQAVQRHEFGAQCLFYLDAHAGNESPLRREIEAVLALPRAVIVVDDFLVPFRPWHLFDLYDGTACGWGYLKDLFEGRNPQVYYPKRSNEDYRGTAIIFVGYAHEELGFMAAAGCFRHRYEDKVTPLLARALWRCLKALRIPSQRYAFWNKLQR